MICPKCNKGTLKAGEKLVRCDCCVMEKLPSGEWINKGSCDFRIPYEYPNFGKLSKEDIRALVSGQSVKNKRGDTATLDLQGEYLLKIDFFKFEEEDL